MDQEIVRLLDEGRNRLREQEKAEAKRIDAQRLAEQAKRDEAQKTIIQAVCENLPDELRSYIKPPEFEGDFIPYDNHIILSVDGLFPIALFVLYNGHAWVEGKWIVVPGIDYWPPQIDSATGEPWEGEIKIVNSGNPDRLYVSPVYTDDISLALAIAERRKTDFIRLETIREKSAEVLLHQIEDRQREAVEGEAPDILPIERSEEIPAQEGQINALEVIETWIREIAQDEIARHGAI